MTNFIKKYIYVILLFAITLSIGFITFLTFIDKSFIKLNESNFKFLLIASFILLLIFLITIFIEIKNSFKENINVRGSVANKKYITFFSLFTLIPSLLISIFSLFLFSFALDKYLDKKITTAVNNSYEIAKNYVDEIRNKIESDIVLLSIDLNKNVNIFYDNPERFKNILKTQSLVRNISQINLVDSVGNLIVSSLDDGSDYSLPNIKTLEMVLNDERPLKIINTFENKSAALIKLNNYIDTYVYIVKFLDPEISNYLKDSEEALNFYYTVEDKSTGIKISFILIYIIIVTLLLFLSISIAIRFSSRFFTSINNLIAASTKIGEGNLEIKVPEIKSDKEMEMLNKNFNLMISKLKTQQEKLLLSERHEAWENVARKLAHEIKNPLTPIQLTIDRIKDKYNQSIKENEKENFNKYLSVIIKQINQIENLVNEFSDFARMPKPITKKNDIVEIIENNVTLLKEIDLKIKINFTKTDKIIHLMCDNEQINRVFLNLIKNSIESIQEKLQKNEDFEPKINIALSLNNDYIKVTIDDNGIGFIKNNLKNIIKPYYTTKSKGSGLGLSIVNKIIYDHNGTLRFLPNKQGATIEVYLPKNAS
jgi:two-component system, NtrC family, nitrogen regulation sensor histidine kinase NtrY